MDNQIVLALPHSQGNPRNSEGAFITLPDGRIMFAYTRFTGNDWADDATADIAARFSRDGGRTWSFSDQILIHNDAVYNIMSVSLLPFPDGRIGMFYLKKDSDFDCSCYLRFMQENPGNWTDPIPCIPDEGYFVVNNDRVVQLSTGRLVIPAAYHRTLGKMQSKRSSDYLTRIDLRGIAMFYLSDDQGATWREAKDWWAFPGRSGSGLQEPGVVEFKDGRLYSWCRTDAGCQYDMYSEDQGETWSAPQPSRFASPCSPLSIKRIPSTGDLLAVWNDTSLAREGKLPPAQPSSWGRTPLVTAISRDDGKTWSASTIIESEPSHGYCYIAIYFTNEAVLLAYCCGGGESAVLQDLCIRRISLDALYA